MHVRSAIRRNPPLRLGRGGSNRARRAFTLLEVIVVIGIVLLLTALTVTVATGVLSKSEVRSTENVLQLLDLSMSEWQGDAERQISWGVDGLPFGAKYDINPRTTLQETNPDDETMLQIVLEELRDNPSSNDILRQIDPEFMRTVDVDGEQLVEVLDAWAKPLYVIHPGRVSEPRTFGSDAVFDSDEDGTVRVSHNSIDPNKSHPLVNAPEIAWEAILGVAKSRRICFVSAGPDGEFGNLSADPNGSASEQREFEATLDNIYSYPVGKP